MSLENFAKENGVKYFLVSFTDLFGYVRSKLVPTRAIAGMEKDGAGFAGFATYLNISPADPDLFAVPDSSSVIQLPWNKEIAWVASDLKMEGKYLEHAPRNVLKKVKEEATNNGYQLKTGVECEFILLDGEEYTVSDDYDFSKKPCYDQDALLRRYKLISKICDYMEELGWDPYQNDHEDGNGQFEMNWGYSDCLTTADRHTFFKFMVKTLAEKEGYRATFMPKPLANITGNGCHTHMSLWDLESGDNIFTDSQGELGLSKIAYSFMAGILNLAKPLTAIMNPTVNSYKRLHASSTLSGSTWSPNTISFTGNNRTHMFRIPDTDRIELRSPDGAANPYLIQASLLAAGLYGVRNNMSPGQRDDTNNYLTSKSMKEKLPCTLIESVNYLEKSEELRKTLGDDFVDSFVKLKRGEWMSYLSSVSEWEQGNYLNI